MKNEIAEPLRTLRKTEYIDSSYAHSKISSEIIASCIEVHAHLGPGLLESVYEEALTREFELQNIEFERQKLIKLNYKGKMIGNHRVDFLVEDKIVVELKAVESFNNIYLAQVMTY